MAGKVQGFGRLSSFRIIKDQFSVEVAKGVYLVASVSLKLNICRFGLFGLARLFQGLGQGVDYPGIRRLFISVTQKVDGRVVLPLRDPHSGEILEGIRITRKRCQSLPQNLIGILDRAAADLRGSDLVGDRSQFPDLCISDVSLVI